MTRDLKKITASRDELNSEIIERKKVEEELKSLNERNGKHFRSGNGAAKFVCEVDGWETHFDNSLEPEEVVKGNTTWLFESSACGQYDEPLIEGLAVSFYPTSTEALILESWKAYHLKPAEDTYRNIIEALKPIYDVEHAFNKVA